MIDSRGALEAVVRHAVELEDDYEDIAPTLTALAACGDSTLVPRLQEALDRFPTRACAGSPRRNWTD
ncbi:hypothetical protein [Micromonospora tulbaghiae]